MGQLATCKEEAVPLAGARPVADLATGATAMREFILLDDRFLPRPRLSLADLDRTMGWPDWKLLLDLTRSTPRSQILVSVPADVFLGRAVDRESRDAIVRFRDSGGTISVLAGWPAIDLALTGFADAVQFWRQLGCWVGLDNFGYAPVPAFWPFAHRLDLVRIDRRLMHMVEAQVLDPRPVGDLVAFLAHSRVPTIILDGCGTMGDMLFARDCGATHGQGPHFGDARISFGGE